jgi:transposase
METLSTEQIARLFGYSIAHAKRLVRSWYETGEVTVMWVRPAGLRSRYAVDAVSLVRRYPQLAPEYACAA